MGRIICKKCNQSFASVGKPCSFHSGATMGEPAASGRYLYPAEQETQGECSVSSRSDDPLLLNEVETVESYIHDKTKSVTDDQKCDRQSECALSNDYLEKSTNLNTLEDGKEKNSGNLILKRNRNNSSDDNQYKGYDGLKKAELDQEDQNSVKSRRKIFKRKLSKKRLQECGEENLDDSVGNSLECSFPNAYLDTSIDVASLEDSENSSKLSKGESITSSVDSLPVPCPSGIIQKANESNIGAKASQFKLSKGESITSSVDSIVFPSPPCNTQQPNESTISAKTSHSKLSKGESITTIVDSIVFPGPPCITQKTNESTISAKTSHSKLSKVESITTIVDSIVFPGPPCITQKTNKSNISAKASQSKLSKGESITSSVDRLAPPCPSSVNQKTNKLNISSKASQSKLSKGDNIISNVNSNAVLGPSSITQKTNKPNFCATTSHFKVSERESKTFIVDSLAVPGPSGDTKKTNESNISAKTSQSDSSFEDSVEEDKSSSICKKCKKEFSDHVFIFWRQHLYKCCTCNYRNAYMFNLEMHVYFNACQSNNFNACEYCNELIHDANKHCNKILCKICKKTYWCMTQLENHTLGHEDYFKIFCWVCDYKISEHIIPHKEGFYHCCKCGYSSAKNLLKKHLYIHRDLELFKCDLCDKRYKQQDQLYQHLRSHYQCKKCWRTFCSNNSFDRHVKKDHN